MYRPKILTKFILTILLELLLAKNMQATTKARNQTKKPILQQVPKTLIFDRHMSSYAGASLIASTRLWLNELENTYLTPHQPNFITRGASTIANNLFNDLLMLTAHEVFGHGYKFRQYGRVVKYQFNIYSARWLINAALSPLSNPSASTFGRYPDDSRKKELRILIGIAGSQGNSVLASELLKTHFHTGVFDHRIATLFFKSFMDLPLYIFGTSKNLDDTGDISFYIHRINKKHQFQGINKLEELSTPATVYFLNPILYTAIWSFYSYIFQGKQEMTIPRFTWDQVAYMPLIRMGLTPFGVIYYLDNYLAINNRTFVLSINSGKSPFYTSRYSGLNLQTLNLWHNQKYAVDITAGLWYQPSLQLNPNVPIFIDDTNVWGGLLSITNQIRVSEHLSLVATILYKTEGFMEGLFAESGFRLGAGLAFHY